MSSVPDFVPDSFTTVEDADAQIAALAALGVSVVRTGAPIELDYYHRCEQGGVVALVGMVTVSTTGRVFVELFDMDPYLLRVVVGRLEKLVTDRHEQGSRFRFGVSLAQGYADKYLIEQVFRDQLNDTPYRCAECAGRMSRARYGRWVHAKCEDNKAGCSAAAHMAIDARKRLFKKAVA